MSHFHNNSQILLINFYKLRFICDYEKVRVLVLKFISIETSCLLLLGNSNKFTVDVWLVDCSIILCNHTKMDAKPVDDPPHSTEKYDEGALKPEQQIKINELKVKYRSAGFSDI